MASLSIYAPNGEAKAWNFSAKRLVNLLVALAEKPVWGGKRKAERPLAVVLPFVLLQR